ncbi:MAG: tetratricopeptide repeat protein [Phycisphaerales bacterium]|nr:tetratricopeptide repeat protein [Phycisphaerales bacterium]
MNWSRTLRTVLAACLLCAAAAAPPARADELRNVRKGEPVPALKLPGIAGDMLDSETWKGSVAVIVCLSAEQRSSELAAMESRDVVRQFQADNVRLVHVTADVVQKAYFQRFREERSLDVPLALDADRGFYAKLGLIVLPTTIVMSPEGKLAHVISLRGPDYAHILEVYIQHTLGKLTDAQLEEQLKARASASGSPKSQASTHRAAARYLREKGQLDAARDELVKARDLDPTSPDILLDLADLSLATSQLDEADKLVSTVLEAQPENRRAKQIKGIALYRRGRLADAEPVLLEALNLNPEPQRIHYYLGRIYEQQGQTAKALEHYREALRRFVNEPGDSASAAPSAPAK